MFLLLLVLGTEIANAAKFNTKQLKKGIFVLFPSFCKIHMFFFCVLHSRSLSLSAQISRDEDIECGAADLACLFAICSNKDKQIWREFGATSIHSCSRRRNANNTAPAPLRLAHEIPGSITNSDHGRNTDPAPAGSGHADRIVSGRKHSAGSFHVGGNISYLVFI